MSRRLVLVLVSAFLVAGCASEPAASPSPEESIIEAASSPSEASPPASPSPTETTDPLAVPDQIDAPYVEAVMAELDPAWAAMLQAIVDARAFDGQEVVERTLAVMTASEATQFVELNASSLEDDRSGWEDFQDPVGPPVTKVQEVVRADPSCVIAKVDRNYDDVYVENEPADGMQAWIVLKPVPDDGRQAEYATEHNPTPWQIAEDVYTSSDTPKSTWC